jgi:YGGT family
MLLVVSAVKLIVEIALMALLGQWLLGLLAGRKRETNVFYQTLAAVTKPFVSGVRRITPRVVIDRHVPVATCVLLAMVWLLATLTKINLCLEVGVQTCQ